MEHTNRRVTVSLWLNEECGRKGATGTEVQVHEVHFLVPAFVDDEWKKQRKQKVEIEYR